MIKTITITDEFIAWVHDYNKKAIAESDDDIIFKCIYAEDWLIKQRGKTLQFTDFMAGYCNAYNRGNQYIDIQVADKLIADKPDNI